jgi:tetratricopeptide (TPR) repeat protein
MVDSRARAAAAFRRVLALDPGHAPAIAGLVEVAAFERDTIELLRTAKLYLLRDSVSAASDYVRWRVAVTMGNDAALGAIRDRFDSLGTPVLQRISYTGQMAGLGLTDADRAVSLVIRRATDSLERRIAHGIAYMYALNRGRPRQAAALAREWHDTGPADFMGYSTWVTMAALFWDGDTPMGDSMARERRLRIDRDTLGLNARPDSQQLSRYIVQQAIWDLVRGDTSRATAGVRWLRATNSHPLGADLVDALLASAARRPDAAALRARIDSLALEGCCSMVVVHWLNLVVARAYEAAGRDEDALRAIRRGVWRFPPQLLSTYLRDEGRLAAKLGDRAGAIRAYRHYLALRADAEPELRPELDRVRAELAGLESVAPDGR